MYRFQTSPQRTPGKKLWVSLLLFLFLILLFLQLLLLHTLRFFQTFHET